MTEVKHMKTNATETPEKSLIERIMALKETPLEALQAQYCALFGKEGPCSNNKLFIWRRIAYRLQEEAYGPLPAATQERVGELIKMYDPVNNSALRAENAPVSGKKKTLSRDRRLPIPGAIIRKSYKGTAVEVKTLENGFEYNEKVYRTLSAVAKAITGDHWNGYKFFAI